MIIIVSCFSGLDLLLGVFAVDYDIGPLEAQNFCTRSRKESKEGLRNNEDQHLALTMLQTS